MFFFHLQNCSHIEIISNKNKPSLMKSTYILHFIEIENSVNTIAISNCKCKGAEQLVLFQVIGLTSEILFDNTNL